MVQYHSKYERQFMIRNVTAFCLRFFIILLSAIFSMEAIAEPRLYHFGLEGKKITAIAVNKWPYKFESFVIAATESSGVFLRLISDEPGDWQYLGLKGKKVISLGVQGAGVGPMDYNIIYAGLQTDYGDSSTALIYRLSFPLDSVWQAADSGLARSLQRVDALAAFDYSGHAPPQPVFCAAGGSIYKYESGHWQVSMKGSSLEYQINFIKEYDWQELWAGGSSGDFTYTPILMHSTDAGAKWEFIQPYPDSLSLVPNACLSLHKYMNNNPNIFIGMEGFVLQSSDNGTNWLYTDLKDTDVRFTGLAGAKYSPNSMFAGGSDKKNIFNLFESLHSIENWQKIETDTLLPAITCMDANDDFTWYDSMSVFIGTSGAGVVLCKEWVLFAEITGRSEELPQNVELYQNYPNPFNPQTVISYQLSVISQVELSIYNIMGQKVRTLVSGQQTAGRHELVWDGTDEKGQPVASGIYFYQMKAGSFKQTKRMLLMR